jgi:hypothetical protein
MSDNRTRMSAEDIRDASIAMGMEVRVAVEAMPDSPSKIEFLRLQSELETFWRHTASPEFLQQWLLVAVRMQA